MRPLPVTALAAIALPQGAFADHPGYWQGGSGHMMWSGGGGYGLLSGLVTLLVLGALVALIVLAVKWMSDSQGTRRSRTDPIDILRERFASGEIEEEEFLRRKKALER